MSRGDALYMKVHVDILDGERIGQLEPLEVYTYLLGYWATATKYRCDTFHPTRHVHYTCARLALRLRLGCRTIARHMQRMLELGLLVQNPDGSITIKGVKSCHPGLGWKEYEPPSPFGDRTVPHLGTKPGHSKRVREYESKTEEGSSSLLPSSEFYKKALRFLPSSPEEPLENIEGKKAQPDQPYNPYAEPNDLPEWNDDGSEPPLIPEAHSPAITPESKRWPKVEAIIASLWQNPITDEFRESVKWKIHNAVCEYPEAVINTALIRTRDKQQRILEGQSEPLKSGPGSYFLGTCKLIKDEEDGK